MRVIDVEHLGRPHVIGCWEVDGMLVDPGPESSLHTVLEKIGDQQPEAVLPVYVHERGAPHRIDPARLLASAERLYGDKLEYLWGKIQPIPEANVTGFVGGESVRGMRAAYPPAHSSHHVCYLHEETGTAFVGDTAACRIPPTDLVIPPTPPPDIDVELWEESIGIIEAWQPEKLALTHFGPIDDPAPHLAEARRRIREEANLARDMDEPTYEADLQERIKAQLAPATADEMFQAVPTAYQWSGLDRYWRKKAEKEAST